MDTTELDELIWTHLEKLIQKYSGAQTSDAFEELKEAYSSADATNRTKILDKLATITINSRQGTEDDRQTIIEEMRTLLNPPSGGGRRKSRSKKRSTRLRKKTRSRSRR